MVLQDCKASMDVRASEKVVRLKVDEMTNSDKLGSGLLAELGNGCLHHLVLDQVKPSDDSFQEPMFFRLFEYPFNLLRTVVVALNKDGILDPSSSHLLPPPTTPFKNRCF